MKIEFHYDFGSPNKPESQRIETERFCRAHDIRPQVPNPHFPVNTLKIMRGEISARSKDCYHRYIDAMYGAMSEQALKMDEDKLRDATVNLTGLFPVAVRTAVRYPMREARPH